MSDFKRMGSPLGAVDNVQAAVKDATAIYNYWDAIRII